MLWFAIFCCVRGVIDVHEQGAGPRICGTCFAHCLREVNSCIALACEPTNQRELPFVAEFSWCIFLVLSPWKVCATDDVGKVEVGVVFFK